MQTIKSVFQEDKPWFCVKDICRIYGLGQPKDVVYSIADENKRKIKAWIASGTNEEGKFVGNPVTTWFVNTDGYRAIDKRSSTVKRLQEINSAINKLKLERDELLKKVRK